jgi:hypothetical protein
VSQQRWAREGFSIANSHGRWAAALAHQSSKPVANSTFVRKLSGLASRPFRSRQNQYRLQAGPFHPLRSQHWSAIPVTQRVR